MARKYLTMPLALALGGLLCVTVVASAVQTTVIPVPNLVASLNGSVSPKRLPANKYVPVNWGVFGKISTGDETHPSALREIDIDIDKDVKINSRDYPVCEGGRRAMEVLNTKAAEKACAEALIGRGKALVEVAFPERTPILLSSGLLVFNGGEKAGITKLLIHLFIPVPRPSAIFAEVKVTRKGSGLQTISEIPVIAGGSGSLIDFKFKIGKTYSYKGKKVGYFEAKCPDEAFKLNVSKLLFTNEAKVPGVAPQTVLKGGLGVPCTTQG